MIWLSNIKNAILVGLAAFAAILAVLAKRSASKLRKTAEKAEKRAAKAEEVAKGYEAAHVVRSKVEQAVEETRQKENAKPKAKLRHGLEGQD